MAAPLNGNSVLQNIAYGAVNLINSPSQRTLDLLEQLNYLNGLNAAYKRTAPGEIIEPEIKITEKRIKKETLMELIQKIKTTAALLGIRLTLEDEKKLSEFTSIAEANKYLIELKSSTKVNVLTQEQVDLLKRVTGSYLDPAVRALEDTIKRLMNEIDQYQNTISSKYREYFSAKAKFESINKNEDATFSKAVNDILSEGYYTLKCITNSNIEFLTPSIICSYIDQEKNINMSVNLGEFYIRIWFADLGVDVMPFVGNIKSGGYYHPHLSSNRLCWGNVANTYNLARKNYDIKSVLECVKHLLSNYNPDSPYERLDRFDMLVNKNKYENIYKYLSAQEIEAINPGVNLYSFLEVIDVNDDGPLDQKFVYERMEHFEHDNDDGDLSEGQKYYYKLYYRRNSLTGQIDNEEFIRASDGTYHDVDDLDYDNQEFNSVRGW